MRKIEAFLAKTHLSQLLKDVEKGEVIAITKHGKTIAMLTPAPTEDPRAAAIKAIRLNRKGVTLGKHLSIKKLIEQDRK